jgi:hypothetical protein
VAPLLGATKPSHIDAAVASLDIDLTDEEVSELEAPYTPRLDFQGLSDDADLARVWAKLGMPETAATQSNSELAGAGRTS